MCANAGNKKEIVRGAAADILEQAASGGPYHEHQLLLGGPCAGGFYNTLEEPLTVLILYKLEIGRTGIGGQSKKHHPFPFMSEERVTESLPI